MRYTSTIATLVILAFATQTASAAASREENIGVGSGAIIGAFAGGPVGFIIGAAIGAKLGDTMHSKSGRIETLQGSLQDSQQSVAELELGVDELNAKIEHLQNTARPELISLMQAGIDMDLLFRTDEFALTDTTGDRLSQMAATLASMPDVRIQLDGFADETGPVYARNRNSDFFRPGGSVLPWQQRCLGISARPVAPHLTVVMNTTEQ